MSPVAGMIADRVSRKWLIVVSLFVWSAVTFSMGYAVSFQQLYWLRAIMGISEALYIPAGLSLIADFHDSKTRSLAVGIHMTGLYTGQALGGSPDEPAATFARLQKPPLFRGLALLFSNISFWIILFYFAVPSLPGWGIKNWLPTLFSNTLDTDMATAGPLSTITIAVSSLMGVITGGLLSDKWVQKNVRGRIYTSAIGLGLTIPALLLIGFGHSLFNIVGAAFCFGFGYGMFDANNMPILCQFVSARYRATAYGLMNMTGVFAGAFITDWLGKATDKGNLGRDFALMSVVVALALIVQLYFLRPRYADFKEE
jgi:MFS family permease